MKRDDIINKLSTVTFICIILLSIYIWIKIWNCTPSEEHQQVMERLESIERAVSDINMYLQQ